MIFGKLHVINKNFFDFNSLVYIQDRSKSFLTFINVVFSFTSPTAEPLGVFKKISRPNNSFFGLSGLMPILPLFSFLINTNPIKISFLTKKFKNLLLFADFKFFKSNRLFCDYFIPAQQLFTTFFSTFYYINNFIFARKLVLADAEIFSFSSDFSDLNYFGKDLTLNSENRGYSSNKLKTYNLIESREPRLKSVTSLTDFFLESFFLLNLSSSFFKVFGISYEVVFYPINRIFQDKGRFQFLISQAGDFLRAYVSRNPYVLYWLNEFIVLFYASISTRSTSALSRFMALRFKKEYY